MYNPLVIPKAAGLHWVWACKACLAPVVIARGRYFWSCDCHKPAAGWPASTEPHKGTATEALSA